MAFLCWHSHVRLAIKWYVYVLRFVTFVGCLTSLLLQARDNVKFLTTLERHFRSVSSGPLAGILDTLPPLMNALRMVWIISRHYSDDARMGALFARIATELCDRVDGAVLLHQLFRMPAADAIDLLRVSKAVLESWQSTYMQVSLDVAGRRAAWVSCCKAAYVSLLR
jgi:dynein heavy chain